MLTLVQERPLVRIEGLTKKFGNVTALEDLSVELPEGRIIGLLGENGSGKTTLLKILAGLYAEYGGVVEIDGERPSHRTKAYVSYLPDKSGFALEKTPEGVMALYRRYFDDFSTERFKTLLDRFDLPLEMAFQEMSKGMIEKVQLSLAMARDARLYLLDEPIGGVDSGAREIVLDEVLNRFDSRSTILIVTHLIHEMERIFDSVVVLRGGRLAGASSCDRLKERYRQPLEEIVKEMGR